MSISKFDQGIKAREIWTKDLSNMPLLSINTFAQKVDELETRPNTFVKTATIVIDNDLNKKKMFKRQTCIKVTPLNKKAWEEKREYVYCIVMKNNDTDDGLIVKIGGTRTGMKDRFGSYLCGHHVIERNKSGKMSVTNAHLYHTIEHGLYIKKQFEFWCWKLPISKSTINILGDETEVISQTFHAYESKCMNLFKKLTGSIPILCDNSDPSY